MAKFSPALPIVAATCLLFGGCTSDSAKLALSDAEPLSAPTEVGTAPMFAVSPTGDEAAAWISAPGGGTDGRLYVSVNNGTPVELRDSLGGIEAHGESPPKIAYAPDGTLAALYVVAKVVEGNRFPLAALRVVLSKDGGKTWSKPTTVTDDKEFGSHNFHTLHAAADGSFYVSWLDGREGKSAAYITRSTDQGVTWAPNQRIAVGEACPCCRTALATASDGTLYAAWRAVLPGNVRDIVVARSNDNGKTFSEPQRAHADDWVFDGCPHAGPSMQVDSKNRLHIAWWTGKPGAAGVYYARSDDGGKTFGNVVPMGVAENSTPAHVQLAIGPSDKVIVVWDDGTIRVPGIRLRVSDDGGQKFAAAQSLSNEDRVARFPVLAVSRNGLSVAWSEQTPATADAEAKAMPNMKDPKSKMGLQAVGDTRVMVRRAALSETD